MSTLRETQERHALDVVNGNLTALMGDFTPAALTKVMGIAANPIRATTFQVNELSEKEAEIRYIGEAGTRVFWSKWTENGGKWQIEDVEERTAK